MTRKQPFFPGSRMLGCALGILLAFSLLTACESTEVTPSDEEYRDQVAAYCAIKAQEERLRFVGEERKLRKTERDLGIRARQAFNRAYALCMESYDLPTSC